MTHPIKQGVGWLSVVLGILTLSMQIYFLPVLQNLTFVAQGSTVTNAMDYMSQPTCILAIVLSLVAIVLGIILIKTSSGPNKTE